jgi:hypothetical protein
LTGPFLDLPARGAQAPPRPFRPDCPGGTAARPMIVEIKQPITCGISAKSKSFMI